MENFDVLRFLDTGFAVFVAGFVLLRLEKTLEKVHTAIDRQSKAFLLLVLNQNGNKKAAQEMAKKMLGETGTETPP